MMTMVMTNEATVTTTTRFASSSGQQPRETLRGQGVDLFVLLLLQHSTALFPPDVHQRHAGWAGSLRPHHSSPSLLPPYSLVPSFLPSLHPSLNNTKPQGKPMVAANAIPSRWKRNQCPTSDISTTGEDLPEERPQVEFETVPKAKKPLTGPEKFNKCFQLCKDAASFSSNLGTDEFHEKFGELEELFAKWKEGSSSVGASKENEPTPPQPGASSAAEGNLQLPQFSIPKVARPRGRPKKQRTLTSFNRTHKSK